MIVSCGEALIDMVPEPVPGGGPMNVAVASARLGAPTAFVGRLSTDHHSERISRYLQGNGVDLTLCDEGPEPTAIARVEYRPEPIFRFEGSNTADMNLTRVDLGRLGVGPHILHGGTLGMFRGRTAETLAALAERHQGIVSVDPNVRPQIIEDRSRWDHFHGRWQGVAHVYKMSDEDAEWIWPSRSIDDCAEELLGGATKVVLATRGAEGATVFTGSGQFEVPARTIDVVDTVGAGDTFVAGVLVGLWDRGLGAVPEELADLSRDDWNTIVEAAVECAAVTSSRTGADPPFRWELSSTHWGES